MIYNSRMVNCNFKITQNNGKNYINGKFKNEILVYFDEDDVYLIKAKQIDIIFSSYKPVKQNGDWLVFTT